MTWSPFPNSRCDAAPASPASSSFVPSVRGPAGRRLLQQDQQQVQPAGVVEKEQQEEEGEQTAAAAATAAAATHGRGGDADGLGINDRDQERTGEFSGTKSWKKKHCRRNVK